MPRPRAPTPPAASRRPTPSELLNTRHDDDDVTPEPQRENIAVVDDPALSPDVARAAAAEIEAAELGDAATAGLQAPGGEAAPDPQ